MMFKGNVVPIFERPIASTFLYLTVLFVIVKILYPLLRRHFSQRHRSVS